MKNTLLQYAMWGSNQFFNELTNTFGSPSFAIIEDLSSLSEHPHETELIEYRSLLEKDYFSDYMKCIPLDHKFLKEHAYTEVQFLKMADRVFGNNTYQERKDFYLYQLALARDLIFRHKIRFLVFENIPHECFDYLLLEICKKNNIEVIFYYTLPLRPEKRKIYMHLASSIEDPLAWIFNSNHPNHEDTQKSDFSFKEYYSSVINPSIHANSFTRAELHSWHRGFLSTIWFSIKSLFLFLRKQKDLFKIFKKSKEAFKFYYLSNDYYLTPGQFYKKLRSQEIVADLSVDYIYLPLHYQPEASTSPSASSYVEQILVIETLSSLSQRFGFKVYVKVHPRRSSIRTQREFFDRIRYLPNIKLIDNTITSYELIKNSVAVATATGSAGLESLLLGKPVIMFGHRFYQYSENVFQIQCLDDCITALQTILDKGYCFNHESDINFFQLIEQYIFEGFTSLKDEGLSGISYEASCKNKVLALIEYLELNNDISREDILKI